MEQDEPSKSLDRPAAEVCEVAGPGEAARGLLDEGMTVRTYLDALAAQGLHADALKVLAYALPKRAAVWWACLIAAEAMGPGAVARGGRGPGGGAGLGDRSEGREASGGVPGG